MRSQVYEALYVLMYRFTRGDIPVLTSPYPQAGAASCPVHLSTVPPICPHVAPLGQVGEGLPPSPAKLLTLRSSEQDVSACHANFWDTEKVGLLMLLFTEHGL